VAIVVLLIGAVLLVAFANGANDNAKGVAALVGSRMAALKAALTTHVSVGTLFGIAMANRIAKIRTVATILVAWVTTLPLAAAIAAGLYVGIKAIGL
jgi:phosphate/sulfate permease